MKNLEIFDYFDDLNDETKSSVPFMIYPNVFSDSRGTFSEVMKCEATQIPFMADCSWIKQINRSVSGSKVIRGCHAQRGKFCQAKYVEALTGGVYDIITDARPESKTFGTTSIFALDPEKQNKLFVPKGFLHAFAVPQWIKTDVIFQYFCDNVYDKESEISINPKTLLSELDPEVLSTCSIVQDFVNQDYMYSDKDLNGLNYSEWMELVKKEYELTGKSWWK